MKSPKFEFDLPLHRAYIHKDEEGNEHMRVVGAASDTLRDRQGDRMSMTALRRMAKQVSEKPLPLLDNHRSTFEFGHTVDGAIVKKFDGVAELIVEFELDPEFPQARKLFNEVQGGGTSRQLSIGGKLNLQNPNATKTEVTTDGITRTIFDIELDHIAATREDKAANPRTAFITAIAKAMDEFDDEVIQKINKGIVTHEDDFSPDEYSEKGVVPFESFRLADKNASWSFTAEDGNALLGSEGGENFARFKRAHAWFDSGEGTTPMKKGSYALPHHKMVDGQMTTFFRGAVAAAAAINGARGGFERASGEELRRLFNHVARHIREFNAEPPEFRRCEEGMSHEDFCKHFEAQGFDMNWLTKEEVQMATDIAKESLGPEVEVKDQEDAETAANDAQKNIQAGLDFFARVGEMVHGEEKSEPAKEDTKDGETKSEDPAEASTDETQDDAKSDEAKSEEPSKGEEEKTDNQSEDKSEEDESKEDENPEKGIQAKKESLEAAMELSKALEGFKDKGIENLDKSTMDYLKKMIGAFHSYIDSGGSLVPKDSMAEEKSEEETDAAELDYDKLAEKVAARLKSDDEPETSEETSDEESDDDGHKSLLDQITAKMDAVVKTVEEKMSKTQSEESVEKSEDEKAEDRAEELQKTIDELQERLSKVEGISGKSQVQKDEDANTTTEPQQKRPGLWGGIFDDAINKATSQMPGE